MFDELKVKYFKEITGFKSLRGSLHALSNPGVKFAPGVNSLRSLKKSLILFTRNKRGEILPRPYFTRP